MAYTVTTFDGHTTITIANDTVDHTTPLVLIGQGEVSYGQSLNQNFLNLLENFASPSPPNALNNLRPLKGQLWFNETTNTINVNTGTPTAPVWQVVGPGNVTITLSGDVSGGGTTSIPVVLTATGVAAGTYTAVTVDAKGRVTAGSNLTFSGDASGTISSGTVALTLANSGVTAGTYNTVTVDAKGRVVAGSTGGILSTNNVWTGSNSFDSWVASPFLNVGDTGAGTVTLDFSQRNNFVMRATGNFALAAPNNLTAGQSGSIVIQQDGTGGHTISYSPQWLFSGSKPALSVSSNSIDVLSYVVLASLQIVARLDKGFA